MPMTVYKLYLSNAGNSSLDIQMDGEIESILMTGEASGCNLLDDGFISELSFLSSVTTAVNDARGSLGIIQSRAGLLTSGAWNTSANLAISSLSIPIAAGERVYLHTTFLGGTVGTSVHAFLYVRDKGIQRMASKRR